MSRSASACVKRYLELQSPRLRRRGSPADLGATREQLELVEAEIPLTVDPLTRVLLHQRAIDLKAKLEEMETTEADFEQIEEEFIENVARWAEQKKISYSALREAGVPAQILRKAGMVG